MLRPMFIYSWVQAPTRVDLHESFDYSFLLIPPSHLRTVFSIFFYLSIYALAGVLGSMMTYASVFDGVSGFCVYTSSTVSDIHSFNASE